MCACGRVGLGNPSSPVSESTISSELQCPSNKFTLTSVVRHRQRWGRPTHHTRAPGTGEKPDAGPAEAAGAPGTVRGELRNSYGLGDALRGLEVGQRLHALGQRDVVARSLRTIACLIRSVRGVRHQLLRRVALLARERGELRDRLGHVVLDVAYKGVVETSPGSASNGARPMRSPAIRAPGGLVVEDDPASRPTSDLTVPALSAASRSSSA